MVAYLSYAVSFSSRFPSPIAITSSLALFIRFRMTTDLRVAANSTLAISMFAGNFTIFRHVARLSTSPTFALPLLLVTRSFILFTSVFPSTIHSVFADKNHDILIVIGKRK